MTQKLAPGEFDPTAIAAMVDPTRQLLPNQTTFLDSEHHRAVVASPTPEFMTALGALVAFEQSIDPERRTGHFVTRGFPGRVFSVHSNISVHNHNLGTASPLTQAGEGLAVATVDELTAIGLDALGSKWRRGGFRVDFRHPSGADNVMQWHPDNRRVKGFVHLLFSPIGTRVLDMTRPPTPQTKALVDEALVVATKKASHFDGKVVLINGQTQHRPPLAREINRALKKTGDDRRPFIDIVFRRK